MSELDYALERLHLCSFEYANAQPNYAPMAAEALESLGHAALISGLMDAYLPRLPALQEGQPLRADEREAARGQLDRASDWLASYEQALVGSTWSGVLAEAFAQVGDGLAETQLELHALVRLGHAVRSLSREDNPVRRRELAFALAYLAAGCQPSAKARENDQPDPWVGRAQGIPAEDNADVIGELLSAVCLDAAERYLADAVNRASLSAGVVVPGAFRFLIPHLPAPTRQLVLVSMISRVRDSLPVQNPNRGAEVSEDCEVARCAESPSEIRYRAACSVHEHAIVMAEACLREEALDPNATLLRAAADAALRLSPPGYQEWR